MTPTADVLKQLVLRVFPQARRIVLFGSRATGRARPDSDVDLLVVTPRQLPRAEREGQVLHEAA